MTYIKNNQLVPQYPPELLLQDCTKRKDYFSNVIFLHPTLNRIIDELMLCLKYPDGASIITVYGPTRVGKTTLEKIILNRLYKLFESAMQKNPGIIPYADVIASGPETGIFQWKDFYYRLLQKLNEPLIDYKIQPLTLQGRISSFSRSNQASLRLAAEHSLYYRGTKMLIVDEAQHIRKISSNRNLMTQMDVIKSLAETTNTIIVLLGTYELLSLTGLSAQLSARSRDIHFARYNCQDNNQFEQFANIVFTFACHLPLKEIPYLEPELDYIYDKTAGCVGLLKNWLQRALTLTLDTDSDFVSSMRKTAEVSHNLLMQVVWEINYGESELEKAKTSEANNFIHDQLRTPPKLDNVSTNSNFNSLATANQPITNKTFNEIKTNKKLRGKVGRPSAKRRKVEAISTQAELPERINPSTSRKIINHYNFFKYIS